MIRRVYVAPVDHFRHTYVDFVVDGNLSERFRGDVRRFRPGPLASRLCPDTLDLEPIRSGLEVRIPDGLRRPDAAIICIDAPRQLDVVLRVTSGFITVGQPELPASSWDAILSGQEAWYRLAPRQARVRGDEQSFLCGSVEPPRSDR